VVQVMNNSKWLESYIQHNYFIDEQMKEHTKCDV
jgi:hypothetical protein